jgi:hypothetical protein
VRIIGIREEKGDAMFSSVVKLRGFSLPVSALSVHLVNHNNCAMVLLSILAKSYRAQVNNLPSLILDLPLSDP